MSRIKCWLDNHDLLPELSDAVQDDPRVLEEQLSSTAELARRNASTLKHDVSFRSVLEEESF